MLTRTLKSACVFQRALTHLAASPSPRCSACRHGRLRAVSTSSSHAATSADRAGQASAERNVGQDAASRPPAEAPLSVTEWSGLPQWRGSGVDIRRRWGRLDCEEVRRGSEQIRLLICICKLNVCVCRSFFYKATSSPSLHHAHRARQRQLLRRPGSSCPARSPSARAWCCRRRTRS